MVFSYSVILKVVLVCSDVRVELYVLWCWCVVMFVCCGDRVVLV